MVNNTHRVLERGSSIGSSDRNDALPCQRSGGAKWIGWDNTREFIHVGVNLQTTKRFHNHNMIMESFC